MALKIIGQVTHNQRQRITAGNPHLLELEFPCNTEPSAQEAGAKDKARKVSKSGALPELFLSRRPGTDKQIMPVNPNTTETMERKFKDFL